MEVKKHYKLYKSGKLWACIAVALATLSLSGYAERVQAATENNLSDTSKVTANNNQVPVDTTTINNNVNANSGNLDNYTVTVTSNNNIQLNAKGWHATGESNNERYRYAIVYDNDENREISRKKITPVTRPDVQRAYSNVDNSVNSGFNLKTVLPVNSLSHSLSIISRYSDDPINGEGDKTDIWFQPIRFNKGNYAFLDNIKGGECGNPIWLACI